MRSLDTTICLPPGILSEAVVREFLHLVFDEYRWFKPVRYGFAGLRERFAPGSDVQEVLLDYYNERKLLTVAAKTDRDFFLLMQAKHDAPPYAGAITWETSATEAKKPAWRAAHQRQVVEVMRLVGAPFAYSGTDEDIERKRDRLVPHPSGFGRQLVFTVNDPSEGLAGLFWRNFYGPPFTRLFGERLSTLPADTRQDLGEGIVLVQPYELPTLAHTPDADARERELIALLGPECFYDHERHLKPTRLPELPR
jgi:hypothetical protein